VDCREVTAAAASLDAAAAATLACARSRSFSTATRCRDLSRAAATPRARATRAASPTPLPAAATSDAERYAHVASRVGGGTFREASREATAAADESMGGKFKAAACDAASALAKTAVDIAADPAECRSLVRTPWPRPRTDEEGRDDTAASSLEYPPSLACGGDAAASLTASDSDGKAVGASGFDGSGEHRE
jgi:hypothetical protein